MQSGQWLESSSERFSNFIQFAPQDLFNSPGLEFLRTKVDFGSVQKMLSIGCGNGRYELPLMCHYPLSVDLIEPSRIMHQQLIRNLENHKGPGTAGLIHHGPFESFTTNAKYDLIWACHSFTS